MEKSTLTVLLIEDNPEYANLVQHWLTNACQEVEFVLNWTDSLQAGLSRLQQGGIDVILLDLGLPDANGMETLLQTKARATKTPILILSSADSESLALQMIQEGAEDYLVKNACDAEVLVRALRRAMVRQKSRRDSTPASLPSSRTINVVGTKGGVGTTTIACVLAAELRQQNEQKVLLADLDADGGNVSFLTGIECKYSIADAVRNIHRLDQNCWESLVAKGPNELDVISSAAFSPAELESSNLRDVLAFTQTLYPWVVLDLGRLSHRSLSLLDAQSDVFVVTTTTIPALYNAKRVIEALRTASIDADHIRLIVNYTGEVQPLSRSDLNRMFGVPVYATVPGDREELYEAYMQKRLPARDSHMRKAIAGVARRLSGLPEDARKGRLTSLVSLAEKFRKPAKETAVFQGQ